MLEHLTLLETLGYIAVTAPMVLVVWLGLPALVGKPLSEPVTGRAVMLATTIGFLATVAAIVVLTLQHADHAVFGFGHWVSFDNPPPEHEYHFALKFVFDWLSVSFAGLTFMLVGTIGAFAHRYMHREPGYVRFFVLYAVFLAGMVFAALSGTIETLFLGWELVGLSSALLVGFFQERPAPVRNALRVWSVYRISDAALLLAAISLHHMSGQGDFDLLTGYRQVDGQTISWPNGICSLAPREVLIVGLLLIVAAAGKSALIPFSGWLPRAMEGPTPSSAVFYGALSVHLGAYLLLRTGPLLDASTTLSMIVLCLGLGTAMYASLVGKVQTDIKSALSFASLTQVGLIVAEIGAGWRVIPLIHLLSHACLRTLQFIRAPNVIRDHAAIESALGHRVPRAAAADASPFRLWLYRFALERGYLDALLDRGFLQPFLKLFRTLNRLDQRAMAILNPSPVRTPHAPTDFEPRA